MTLRLNSLAIAIFLLSISALGQSTGYDNVTAQAGLVSEFDVNGLKVIYKRRPQSPTVAGGLFVRGGARNISEKNAGIERLMLATAIEAGKGFSRQAVRRELSSGGSTITSGASNDYSAIVLATTKADFGHVFDIFADVLLNPLFSPEDVDRNKDQILTGLRESGSVPEAALETLQDKIIYAGHPYANNVNGTAQTITAITPPDLRAYHKNTFETSRLLFVFVGDLDPEMLKSKIAATFGKLPKGAYEDRPLPSIDFSKGTLDSMQRALPTNYVKGVFAAPPINDRDYYAMRVAMSILQTLVYREVRTNLQLSYAPDAAMESFAANTANISVSTTDPNTATAAMLSQIRFLQERSINPEVIEEIAAYFLTRHYLAQETSAAQVGELARYELIGGGWRNSFEFLKGVRAVTPADIRTVANKYMKNIRFAVVGDAAAINKSIFLPADE
jgi:zinc protease